MTEQRTNRERILSALHEYVNLGFPIIPLCSNDHKGYSERHIATCNQAGKIPLIKGWKTHQTTTKEQLKSWIREFRNINIGLPLGNASGFIGIDVDGVLGEEMLMEMSGGDLPETLEYVTGDGRRLLYEIPVGLQTKKFVNTGEGPHQECSILADGQQTVLPPSVHHTGRTYEWVEGRSPQEIDCALAPRWLIDLVAVDNPRRGTMTFDLTKDELPTFQNGSKVVKVEPILVTEATLPSIYMGFEDMDFDGMPPDTDYVGKEVKTTGPAKEEKIELYAPVEDGGRDNEMTKRIGHLCAVHRGLGKEGIMIQAKAINQACCVPPLDEMAIEAKVHHFWEQEQMKSAQFKSQRAHGDKIQYAPQELANTALQVLGEQGYLFKVDPDRRIIWTTKKEEGPWIPIDAKTDKFHMFLVDIISNPEHGGDPAWTKEQNYKDVAHNIVIRLRQSGQIWTATSSDTDTQTIDAFKYIPLKGGKLLDWRTGELKAWDPDSLLTYTLPVEFDPRAKCPTWEERLQEWLPDEGSRLIMQEFIGYSLIPYMGFEKALMIQGEGANGKSLFLETIQGMLGYQVTGSVNMQHLFSRFGKADLFGKILNIVNEAGSDYLRGGAADEFKNMVSGGRLIADVKNQSAIPFNNMAKFVFSSNHDVKTGDKSEGWLRRLLIVPFEQDFSKSTTPKFEIMEPLKREYSGIFNWAIEGLRRLVRQQQFSESATAIMKKEQYINKNDIAADFFRHCLQPFDIGTADPETGKALKRGTPSSVINTLFGHWLEYRESSVQKKVEHITNHLETKWKLKKQRTKNVLFKQSKMTECWIGLRVHITDAAFLEMLLDDLSVGDLDIKQYAQKRLDEIDRELGIEDAGHRVATVANIPDSQAK